jgi:hypothetical protein
MEMDCGKYEDSKSDYVLHSWKLLVTDEIGFNGGNNPCFQFIIDEN